jgi:hypothetical protein
LSDASLGLDGASTLGFYVASQYNHKLLFLMGNNYKSSTASRLFYKSSTASTIQSFTIQTWYGCRTIPQLVVGYYIKKKMTHQRR